MFTDTAARNALAMFEQAWDGEHVDYQLILDELQHRNGGKPLSKNMLQTLARMVAVFELSKAAP
jgi:hypothetical protein